MEREQVQIIIYFFGINKFALSGLVLKIYNVPLFVQTIYNEQGEEIIHFILLKM